MVCGANFRRLRYRSTSGYAHLAPCGANSENRRIDMYPMDWNDELTQLVRLCSKRALRGFPQEEYKPFINRIKSFLEQHGDDPAIAGKVKKLKDVLLLHNAVSQKSVEQKTVSAKSASEIVEKLCYVVIDTNIFFHCENILDRLDKSCIFVLPRVVLDELENRAKTKNYKSRQSQRILTRIRQFPAHRILQLDTRDRKINFTNSEFSPTTQNDLCDNRILAAAKQLLSEKKQTQLLSNDNLLRKKAAELKIPALSLREFLADW
ncbi:MAG: hypothetical protein LBK06_01745 [Planctomycetaceae bacterium]|jgi:rRNA-processing protein FCF1|nr:hypothetical protein [Planctomycetaceae bacterium]